MFYAGKSFKAAVLFKQNNLLRIIKLKLPEKLEKGQVLVRVIKAAICGAQIGEIKGTKGHDKWLPHCMGHEGYGVVIAKHPSVKKIKLKDHVVMHWRKGAGIDAKSPSYTSKFGTINAGQVTTFQELSIVSENRITKIKSVVKKNQYLIPLLGCAIPTSWGIIKNEIKIDPNQKTLIFGAGGVGCTIALLLKVLGYKKSVITDKFNKQKLTKKIDINFMNFLLTKKIKTGYFGNIIDTTGDTKIMELAFNLLGKNGNLMLVGQPKRNSRLIINDPLKLFNPPCENIKLMTSDGGLFEPSVHMKYLYKLLQDNLKSFKKIITHKVKLDNINTGIKYIQNGLAIRVGIDIH